MTIVITSEGILITVSADATFGHIAMHVLR